MPPPVSDTRRAESLLLFLGALMAVLFAAIGRLPRPLEAHAESYVPVFLLTFIVYLIALVALRRAPDSGRVLLIIICIALVFRLIALFQPPSLSTDLWRYIWDGHIGSAGINPYRYPPSDPTLAAIRTPYWPILNHPTWVTMYPPLSQRLFTLLAFFGGSGPVAFKAVFVLVDLGSMGLLLTLLRRLRLPQKRVLLYAWHPLVVMEIAGSGHQDVLGIFFMLAAVLWIRRSESRREGLLGGAGAGLSLMSKGYLLPALPLFARKRPVYFALAFGVVVAALLIPYMGHQSQILIGMNKYLHNRLRNAGLYAWTFRFLHSYTPKADSLTRLLTTVALGIIVAFLAWRPWFDEGDLLRRSTTAMGAFFLLSNTIYPWYATWLVPGLCFTTGEADRDPMIGWLLWSGLISLAYLNPLPGRNDWVVDVEYLPVLALFALQGRLRMRRRRGIPMNGNPTPPS